MKQFYFVCLALAVSVLCSCSSDIKEEVKTGSISGSVSDRTTGEPVSTVNVGITPGGSQTLTGSDGSFSFLNLAPGNYTLSFRKEEYNPITVNAVVEAGKTTSLHTTVDRLPAQLTADKTLLDFGENLSTLSFTIVNKGYTDLTYKIETGRCPWLTAQPETDVLGYGKTATIVVNLNRDILPDGENEANIVVRSTSGNGNVEIKVTAINNAKAAVNTLEVTDVASTSATLNGEIINVGSPAYNERGFVCSVEAVPTMSNYISLNSCPVTSEKKYSAEVQGRNPRRTYYARAYVKQNGEVIYGNIVSFTTSMQTTELSTSAVTQVGATTATFNASVQKVGLPAYTEKGFCYSKNANPTINDNRKPVSGSGEGAFSLSVTNLEFPVKYYVRAYAIQDGNPVYGNIVEFSTKSNPVKVSTYAATGITSYSAQLNGHISETGLPAYTEKGFCISQRYNSANIQDTKIVVSGSDAGAFSARINGLNYNQTYYFCSYAIQNGSVVYGNILGFTTTYSKASVVTQDVSNVKYTSATLNATVAEIGDPGISERGFCYKVRSSYYDTPYVSDKVVKVSGVAAGAFKADLNNLEEDETYIVRAYVIQDGNVIYGGVKEFATGYPPQVVTGPAVSVSAVSATSYLWKATFQGAFDDGNPQVTEVGFVYSSTTMPTVNSGTVVKATSVSNISSQTYRFTRTVSDLIPYSTYYFRAYAKTPFGYVYGEPESVTTN